MLFILITYTFFLIGLSSGDQCPSSEYCTCSSDLTIIECTNRQLTNELLLKLNRQLPNSIILLNLSSNLLTSIKSLSNLNSLQILDLSFNKIRYLPPNIFSKFPQLTSLYIQNNSIKTFPKNFLQIDPQQSQIVYENQQFILNCSSNSKHFWTLNKNFYPSTIISPSYSTIIIHRLQINHSGIWTCHNTNFNRSISLTVLKNSSNHFCQSIQMNTSKGYFYWPRTLINKKIEKKCPFGSAAWLSSSNEYARAWYTCSSNGQWKNFDISQCGYQTNISRVFDRLSLNETNLLLNLVKYLSKINRNHMKLDDIILLIDLIDEQQEKYKNQDRIMLIYHLTDFILQIKHDFILVNQYHFAITRLRLIIERLLDFTNQSWLYIGKELTAMTVQSPLSSTVCFIPNRSLLTIICDINNHQYKSALTTIQFPSHSNKTNEYSLFRLIVYRRSTIFTSDKINNNPVIYIRPVTKNNFSTIKLTFFDQSNEVSIGLWDANQISWQITSSICKINEQNKNLISTNCILFNNNSLSITYFNKKKNNFFNRKYSQLIISISSIIASICFIISIVFYSCFHKIFQMPRRFFHCLINYWFSLAILLPLFAFGIQLNQYPFLCQFIAISLHYLCLTTILWLTLLTYSIWRKLYVISKDKKSSILIMNYQNDGLSIRKFKFKSIIQYYLLAYGIGLIICGINVVVSREQYIINKICFLKHFYSILILIIPIIIFSFFILIFLLISRNYIKKFSNKSRIKSNEIFPILILPNINSHHSLDIDHKYESINQLLSILSQLILLIFLFLSSLTIILHPLYSFKLHFEHIIYSHLYGFFVLFLSFYILSFHILSRSHLIIRYYSNRKKNDYLSNKSSSIISNSHDLSTRHESEVSQNNDHICTTKRLKNITSKYYLCHHPVLNSNSSRNISNDVLPLSSSDTISRETIDTRNSFFERSSKRSINIPLNLSPLTSSRSFTHPPISPSQAIIRPLPIIRFSSQDKNKNFSINQNSYCIISSPSTEEFYVINKTNNNESSNEKLSIKNESHYDHEQVLFIDEDDEHSVSLKSSISNSKTSSCLISNKKNRSQTLSISSSSSSLSSSSSSNFSNDFHTNQIKLHESSV